MADRVFAVVLMVIVGGFWMESLSLPDATGGAAAGPAFLPRIILSVIFVMAVLVLIQSIIKPEQAVRFTGIKAFLVLHWRVPALLGVVIGYIALMDAAGFVVASMTFLAAAFSLLIRERTRGVIMAAAAVTLGLPITLQWAFETLLRTVLP